MPFPKLKTCHVSGFGSVARLSSVEKSDGTVETKYKPCNEKLPPANMFDIASQVQAGVTLQEVNTKILGSGVSTEDLAGIVNKAFVKKVEPTTSNQDSSSEEN